MKGTTVKKGNRHYPVFDLGRDPRTGKRRQKWGPGFRTKGQAEKALTELVSQVNRGTYVAPVKLTVQEWVKEFLATYCSMRLRPNVQDSYRQMLQTHVVPYLGARRLNALTASDLDTRYAEIVSSGRSPTTAGYVHRIVHTMLKIAVKKRRISHNVAKDADPPRQNRPNIEVRTRKELLQFKEAVAAERSDLFPICDALSGTGARIGEVLGCRWRDLSLDAESPKWSVLRTVSKRDNGELHVDKPKTKKGERSIVLTRSLALVLLRLREQREADAEYCGRVFSEDDYVFIRPDGSLPDRRHVGRVFNRIAIRAGLKPIPLHGLRHTHATLLLMAGVHPKVVSERLGHASVAITLDIYSHVVPGLQEAAAKTFDSMMDGASEIMLPKQLLEKC